MAELPVDHLSYSSLNAYWTCPRAWRFRYVDKIPTLPTPSLVFGSAFHQAIEAIIKSQASEEEYTSIDEVWGSVWAKVQLLEQEIDWQGEMPEELYNLGARMLAHEDTLKLLATISPKVDDSGPMIERQVKLLVPGVPIPIIGFIDMIDIAGIPYDFKTSAKMWTRQKAEDEIQPIFYHAALNQMGHRGDPVGMLFRHYVFAKTKVPQAEVFITQRTPTQVFWLLGAIRETWQGMLAGVFPPNPTGWACSPKYCPYWRQCRGKT